MVKSETYGKYVSRHIQKQDIEISEEERRRIEREQNGFAMSALRCFNVGLDLENQKNSNRIASAVTSSKGCFKKNVTALH